MTQKKVTKENKENIVQEIKVDAKMQPAKEERQPTADRPETQAAKKEDVKKDTKDAVTGPVAQAKSGDDHTELAAAKPEDRQSQSTLTGEKLAENRPEDDIKNRIEALLFASGKAMEEAAIMELCQIDKRQLKKALDGLQKDYDAKNGALMIVQDATAWKITVREKYLSLVRRIVADTELPKSTMETLAVIAWKTPVYQSEIVRIRGNKCYDHIQELEDLGFVTKDKKGRSFILKTTDKFYNYFDIDHGQIKQILDITPQTKAEQTTLNGLEVVDENKPAEKNEKIEEIFADHKQKLLGQLEIIETKKREYTDEEKEMHKNFLEDMERKLSTVSQRTTEIESELPNRKRDEMNALFEDKEEPQQEADSASIEEVVESSPETTQAPETTTQDNAYSQEKPKALTKKQLEKKFKEDIERVKESMKKKD